jgi:hypothetical protein
MSAGLSTARLASPRDLMAGYVEREYVPGLVWNPGVTDLFTPRAVYLGQVERKHVRTQADE